jgi:hypothetical protein
MSRVSDGNTSLALDPLSLMETRPLSLIETRPSPSHLSTFYELLFSHNSKLVKRKNNLITCSSKGNSRTFILHWDSKVTGANHVQLPSESIMTDVLILAYKMSISSSRLALEIKDIISGIALVKM